MYEGHKSQKTIRTAVRLTPRDDLDALPGMSQQYGCQRKPEQDNNNRHDNTERERLKGPHSDTKNYG